MAKEFAAVKADFMQVKSRVIPRVWTGSWRPLKFVDSCNPTTKCFTRATQAVQYTKYARRGITGKARPCHAKRVANLQEPGHFLLVF